MRFNNLVEGLKIFQLYFSDRNGFHAGAEHDALHVYPTDLPMPEEDVNKVKELGWCQFEMESEEEYQPSEGWVAYV